MLNSVLEVSLHGFKMFLFFDTSNFFEPKLLCLQENDEQDCEECQVELNIQTQKDNTCLELLSADLS